MDYSQMNHGSWNNHLSRFKDLLRPDGLSCLGAEEESAVEAARADPSAFVKLAAITAALPNLVFEGYDDWYRYQDEWVLRNLGHVLTAQEEYEILAWLDQNTPQSMLHVLEYVADERLSVWQNDVREQFAESLGRNEPGVLTGFENTSNWNASRTPGTYYYTWFGDRYLYSDLPEGPAGAWKTLPEREQLATEKAQPWGGYGWYYTPTDDAGLYGGAYVYAAGDEGPWLTEEAALARSQAPVSQQVSATRRYDQVGLVGGHPDWAQGYDTVKAAWKYARVTANGLPDDDAAWFAVNDVSADGAEYFVGPGYSATGWLLLQRSESEKPATAEQNTAHAHLSENDQETDADEIADPRRYTQQLADELGEEILAELVEQCLSEQGEDDALAELLETSDLNGLRAEITGLAYDTVWEELGYEHA